MTTIVSPKDPVPLSSLGYNTYPIEIGYWRDTQREEISSSSSTLSVYPLPQTLVEEGPWWTSWSVSATTPLLSISTTTVNDNKGLSSSFDRFLSTYSIPELCLYYIQSRFLESYELAPSYCRFSSCTSSLQVPSAATAVSKDLGSNHSGSSIHHHNLEQRYKDLGCSTFTDGVYIWPEGYAHYLGTHRVRPPVSFVQHILGMYQHYYCASIYNDKHKRSSIHSTDKTTFPSDTFIPPHYSTVLPNLSLLQYDITGTQEFLPLPKQTYSYLLTHSSTFLSQYLDLSSTKTLYSSTERRQDLLREGEDFLRISRSLYTTQNSSSKT